MKLKEVHDDDGKVVDHKIPTLEDPESRIAVCFTADVEIGISSQEDDMVGKKQGKKEYPYDYQCNPDGKTYCIYKKEGLPYVKLLCECGLSEADGRPQGYCPIPGPELLKTKNYYMHKMWNRDNCHTLDRHSFRSQLECGIGTNFGVLANATKSSFQTKYFPYIQYENEECM